MKKTTITRFLILILSAILLQACGGAAKRTGGVASQDIEVLIRQAINAPANKKDGLLIEAAGLLVLDSRYDKAQELLIHVNQNKLMPTQQDDFKLYYAETLIALGANEAALKQITGIKASSKKSIKWQVRYGTALADIYLVNGNYYEAAKTRIELNDLFTNSKLLQENNEKIWLALDQIEPEFLKSYTTSFNNKRLNGWLELVYINKKWGHDPQKLLAEIRGWKNRYPLHQAQTHQPKILVQTSSAKPYKPTHIAVMLPLSGKNEKVGKMIHDGIIAAHYQNQNAASAPKISFHDTAKTGSVMGLYKKSINDGADFILGPLLKNAVEELITQEELQIPVLALNRLEEVQLLDPKVFQFGLPIEDEAVLAAERAIEKGYKKAIAFLPENSTGSRAEKSFKAHFESLGGTLVYVQKYKSAKNLKQDVQSLLGVNKSMSRKLSLEQLLGRNLEFEMRRREDADFVFVLANHSLGRQIKPFINYYYGHDLPILATSSIYSGKPDPKKDLDLNGIEFVDLPLLLSNQPQYQETREILKELQPDALGANGRYFALGYDGYNIMTQLPILQAFPHYRWHGLIGNLGVDDLGLVHRTLPWAKFVGGVPKVIKEQPIDVSILKVDDQAQKLAADKQDKNTGQAGK